MCLPLRYLPLQLQLPLLQWCSWCCCNKASFAFNLLNFSGLVTPIRIQSRCQYHITSDLKTFPPLAAMPNIDVTSQAETTWAQLWGDELGAQTLRFPGPPLNYKVSEMQAILLRNRKAKIIQRQALPSSNSLTIRSRENANAASSRRRIGNSAAARVFEKITKRKTLSDEEECKERKGGVLVWLGGSSVIV